MISHSFQFALKVWLTSVLFSPFLFFVICGTLDLKELRLEAAGIDGFIIFSLLLGFLLSIPNLIVFGFAVKFINKKVSKYLNKKIFIASTGILLTCMLFYFIFFRDAIKEQRNFDLRQMIAYSLTIAIGIFIYKLKLDE